MMRMMGRLAKDPLCSCWPTRKHNGQRRSEEKRGWMREQLAQDMDEGRDE